MILACVSGMNWKTCMPGILLLYFDNKASLFLFV